MAVCVTVHHQKKIKSVLERGTMSLPRVTNLFKTAVPFWGKLLGIRVKCVVLYSAVLKGSNTVIAMGVAPP